jgi:Tol biopolymer transport system component
MPVWSPSGDSFAYYSVRDIGDTDRLVVHRPDGKETVVAEPIGYTQFPPHWCGSGDRLLSWGTPNPRQTRLFDSRTGEASPPDFQVAFPGGNYQYGFSPDCKSVYVSTHSRETRQRRIYRSDTSGEITELFTDSGDWATVPRVSPDGRWLALYGKLEGGKESGILLLSTAGGPLRMLDLETLPGHVWTPDSKRLMYVRTVKRPDGQGKENELYWVPVEGGTPQATGIRMRGPITPSLNPDGKRLLFSTRETTNEFWVLRNLPLN